MSQENVEVVRRVIEAESRRDIEAIVAEHQADAEITVLRSAMEGPYKGLSGVRRMYRELFDFVPDVEFEIDRILDCGESVVVIGRQRGTMRQAMFDQVLAAVIELRAGKITRTRSFESAEEALEAVGLSE